MSIADDLRQAELEMALSFSQAQWETAILSGWMENRNMSAVIAMAAGLSRPIDSQEEWARLIDRAASLRPSFNPNSRLSQPCRAWLATHAREASDLFWDGSYDKGKRLLKSSKYRGSASDAARRSEVSKSLRQMNETVFVKARQLSKRHDWNTCK